MSQHATKCWPTQTPRVTEQSLVWEGSALTHYKSFLKEKVTLSHVPPLEEDTPLINLCTVEIMLVKNIPFLYPWNELNERSFEIPTCRWQFPLRFSILFSWIPTSLLGEASPWSPKDPLPQDTTVFIDQCACYTWIRKEVIGDYSR